MSRTANIFRPSDLDTFALPLSVFNRLLADPGMKVSTVLVYCYILSRATAPTVRIYIGDALADTGLSRPVFIEARETLIAAELGLGRGNQQTRRVAVRDSFGERRQAAHL